MPRPTSCDGFEPGRAMSSDHDAWLADNCSALAARDPGLAARLLASAPDPSIEFVTAHTGHVVPAFRDRGGLAPLHSRYDPVREADRQEPSWEGAGFLVAVGLGGGFLVRSMLRSSRVCAVLVVERDLGILRSIFGNVPLRMLIEDERTNFLPGTDEVPRMLSALWQPGLMGGLRTVALHSWCARQRDFCDRATAAVAEGVRAARADHSVQAHFGRRWFVNILHNLPAASARAARPLVLSSARVAAAGPSLDAQLGRLAGSGAEGPLLAVDTALPALVRAGVHPDAVVSIDCQAYGYHHFMQGVPPATRLYLDLASPPLLARRQRDVSFVAGNHPFCRYLQSRWRRLPFVDTSGGNVTHAAVSLALGLGAAQVTLYGADFSYPSGKPYARGTYVYDVFGSASSRTAPVESSSFGFVLRSSDARAERSGGHLRYTTALLSEYRDRLLALVEDTGARLVAVPGPGLTLAVGSPASSQRGSRPVSASTPEPSQDRAADWRAALAGYAADLESLEALSDPPWQSLRRMDRLHVEVWTTLLPVSACMAREREAGPGESAALAAARAWALDRVRRMLDEGARAGSPGQE